MKSGVGEVDAGDGAEGEVKEESEEEATEAAACEHVLGVYGEVAPLVQRRLHHREELV
jgi:hypothetical protein